MNSSHRVFQPLVATVDFHHLRGPEIEQWFGLDDRPTLPQDNDWTDLAFLALPDGSHAVEEELSCFTLRYHPVAAPIAEEGTPQPNLPSSLFGIACTRHIRAEELLHRSSEVTRTSVQKAVVAIVDTPYLFARIRENLSIITHTWFAQRDFRNVELIDQFQKSLLNIDQAEDGDEYFGEKYDSPLYAMRLTHLGLSLRELIHEYKAQTMVLFKCALLQPKMLFFGTQCERLCLLQFALISLIPGLLRSLQDCADSNFNSYEETLIVPNSLKTSDRQSLMSYMGLPLQIFGKGSFFGPYTPLQQLDILSDLSTSSFMAGSTNSLLLLQKSRYSEIFVNLDEHSIEIFDSPMRNALALSVADRRFIDFLVKTVNETWDQSDHSRPSNHGYSGSEDFIRLQFEEYLLALLSAVKYKTFVEKHGSDAKAPISDFQRDSSNEFGAAWVDAWMKTENYRIFNKFTDSHLFDIVEPRHPTAGALSVEDIQRRVAQQVTVLHLDERFNSSREVLGKHLATGQKKVSTAFNQIWADIEVMREAQRKRVAESRAASGADDTSEQGPTVASQAQANVQMASARAGAYMSSWGIWAAEKRKTGFKRSSSASPGPPLSRLAETTASEPSNESGKDSDEMPNPDKDGQGESTS